MIFFRANLHCFTRFQRRKTVRTVKVRIHCLRYLNLVFLTSYAIFLKLCDRGYDLRSIVRNRTCDRVISDGLLMLRLKITAD